MGRRIRHCPTGKVAGKWTEQGYQLKMTKRTTQRLQPKSIAVKQQNRSFWIAHECSLLRCIVRNINCLSSLLFCWFIQFVCKKTHTHIKTIDNSEIGHFKFVYIFVCLSACRMCSICLRLFEFISTFIRSDMTPVLFANHKLLWDSTVNKHMKCLSLSLIQLSSCMRLCVTS